MLFGNLKKKFLYLSYDNIMKPRLWEYVHPRWNGDIRFFSIIKVHNISPKSKL